MCAFQSRWWCPWPLRTGIFPREYALHSNAAYRKPEHPGPLIILAGTTLHMSNTLWDQHKERLRAFREVQGVEQALRQQIVSTIEPQYLEAFRNTSSTGKISLSVYNLIKQLYQMYGRVTPQKLQAQEDNKVRQMVYDPVNPINGFHGDRWTGTLYRCGQLSILTAPNHQHGIYHPKQNMIFSQMDSWLEWTTRCPKNLDKLHDTF